MVVRRRDLDEVRRDDVQAYQPPQDGQELAAGEPAGLGCTGPGRVRGVEHVDVDRDVDRRVGKARSEFRDGVRDAPGLQVHRRHDREPEALVVHEVVPREQRAADPDVRGVVLEQQALLPRSAERRPVRVGRAEVRVPRIQVRVEVQERDRSVPALHHPEQRKRDRVVAADREEVLGPGEDLLGPGFDLPDRLHDVERVASDVSGVGHLLVGEGLDLEAGVVAAEQPRGLPHGDRAEPSARPERGPAVERHAEHRDVASLDLVPPGESSERGWPREPGYLQRIDRADAGRLAKGVARCCHGGSP